MHKKQVLIKKRKEEYPTMGGNVNHHDVLCEIVCLLKTLVQQGETMAKTFADLQASVSKLTTASKSALALIKGIVEKLKACETVQDFEAVTSELDANTAELTDAVTANTPSEPPPA